MKLSLFGVALKGCPAIVSFLQVQLEQVQTFSYSTCSTSTSMEDGYIYRGEEEVGIHTIVEGRPYPLGGSPYGGKKRPKEEGRGY